MCNMACYCEEWLELNAPNMLYSSRANSGSESAVTSKVRFERKSEISELKVIDIEDISNEQHWRKIQSMSNKNTMGQIHVPILQL